MDPSPAIQTASALFLAVYARALSGLYDIADCFPFLSHVLFFTEDCIRVLSLRTVDD